MASLERSLENFESEGWVLVSQSDPLPELRLDVALLPSLIQDARSVFAVVDVLRASTSIVTLLERGVPAVIPSASVEEARALRKRFPGHLLCGEQDGLPPPGFDYGNSPAEFAAASLDRRPPILATPPDAPISPRAASPAARAGLPAALASARHGAELIAAGFAADIEHCARLDASACVPLLHRDGDGLLALRAYGRP